MTGNQEEDELDQVLFEGNKVEEEKQAKNSNVNLQQQSDEDEDSSDDDDDLEIILDGGTDGNTLGGSSLFQSGAVGLVQSGMSANMQKSNLQSSSGGGQSLSQQQHSLDGKSLQYSSAQSHIQQSQQQSQSQQQPAMDEVIPIRRGMINIDGIGIHRDKPILDFNIDLDIPDSEKGWMKPGADVTDYFNYGFTEDTWRLYCIKQRELRDELAINKKSVFDRAAILKEYQQKIGSSSSGGKQTGDSAQVDSSGDYQQQKQYQQGEQRDLSQSQRGSDYRHYQQHYAQQDHVSKSRERKRSRDVSRHSYGGRAPSAGDVRDYSQTRDKRYKVDYDNQLMLWMILVMPRISMMIITISSRRNCSSSSHLQIRRSIKMNIDAMIRLKTIDMQTSTTVSKINSNMRSMMIIINAKDTIINSTMILSEDDLYYQQLYKYLFM
ncbi:hypothetical protein MP228_001930 [Amoeboaphelidium protococcarum]|nr:hypothetical protein MP228_001930 [Amoeboaphelidium protococcarum]